MSLAVFFGALRDREGWALQAVVGDFICADTVTAAAICLSALLDWADECVRGYTIFARWLTVARTIAIGTCFGLCFFVLRRRILIFRLLLGS